MCPKQSHICVTLIVNYLLFVAWLVANDKLLFPSILNSVSRESKTANDVTLPENASINTTIITNFTTPFYKHLLGNDVSKHLRRNLPLPIDVMEKYKKLHSVEALIQNPDLSHRKFAVGYYTCPSQAGVHLHIYYNALLWAVLTNRTFLWKYYDRETCLKKNRKKSRCDSSNHIEDCDELLVRTDWLPSFDYWSQKLGLDEPIPLPFHATNPKDNDWSMKRNKWHDGDERLFGADDFTKYPAQVVVFANSRGDYQSRWLLRKKLREAMLQKRALETLRRLHDLGINFMYGMFHRYSFDFGYRAKRQPSVVENTYSIALHSRHRIVDDDGCDIQLELECLEVALKNRGNQSALVYMMSDRRCTTVRLLEKAESLNVKFLVSSHEEGKGLKDEHGPYAGAGYFQDLALASQARDFLIAGVTTSSNLLHELIEFNRKIELWKAGVNMSEAGEVNICEIRRDFQPIS